MESDRYNKSKILLKSNSSTGWTLEPFIFLTHQSDLNFALKKQLYSTKYYVTFKSPDLKKNDSYLPATFTEFSKETLTARRFERWLCLKVEADSEPLHLVLEWVLEEIKDSIFYHLMVQIEIEDRSGYRIKYKCQTN